MLACSISAAAPATCCWPWREARRARAGQRFLPSDAGGRATKRSRGAAPAVDCSKSDALALPLADASLDLMTVAFGFRNLANYEAGLVEMRRVLRPGGMAAILEFSQPPECAASRASTTSTAAAFCP